jgi:hypothetical protein
MSSQRWPGSPIPIQSITAVPPSAPAIAPQRVAQAQPLSAATAVGIASSGPPAAAKLTTTAPRISPPNSRIPCIVSVQATARSPPMNTYRIISP